jgi:hypothetical protein
MGHVAAAQCEELRDQRLDFLGERGSSVPSRRWRAGIGIGAEGGDHRGCMGHLGAAIGRDDRPAQHPARQAGRDALRDGLPIHLCERGARLVLDARLLSHVLPLLPFVASLHQVVVCHPGPLRLSLEAGHAIFLTRGLLGGSVAGSSATLSRGRRRSRFSCASVLRYTVTRRKGEYSLQRKAVFLFLL